MIDSPVIDSPAKAPTQKERVLELLRESGPYGLCASHMYSNCLPNGRNRIMELRKEGWCISSSPCQDEHVASFFRYRLNHELHSECELCKQDWRLFR